MEVVEVERRYRRLFFLTLVSLSAWLLAGCTPAAPAVLEPCPVPVNLPLEGDPMAAALPEALVSEAVAISTAEVVIIEVTAAEPAVASLPPKPVSAAPKPGVTPPVTVAPAPVQAITEAAPSEDAPPEAAPVVFTGPPPVVVAHTPVEGAGVEWSQDIRILFSAPMDRAATLRAITVTPEIEYSVSWHREDKMIRLVPSELLIAFQWYVVNVGADAAAADGHPMGTGYGFTFWGEEP